MSASSQDHVVAKAGQERVSEKTVKTPKPNSARKNQSMAPNANAGLLATNGPGVARSENPQPSMAKSQTKDLTKKATGVSSKTGADVRPLRIFFKISAQESTVPVKVTPNGTIDSLKKAAVQKHLCSDQWEVRLVYGGKILEAEKLLSDYGIVDSCTVHLILPNGEDVASQLTCETSAVLQRSSSLKNLSARPQPSVRRSHSTDSIDMNHERISCTALRYDDMTWQRGERGKKTSKGFLVRFGPNTTLKDQDTAPEHIKLCPGWWKSLTEEDVISLEPLSRLKYEPFELPSSTEKTHWFDGKILANYLISSANFVHPVSRRPLERLEMIRLDEYLRKHSLGKAMVVHVFDRKDDSSENAVNHVGALRREASDILAALFESRNAEAAAAGRRRAERSARPATSATDAASQRPRRDGRTDPRDARRASPLPTWAETMMAGLREAGEAGVAEEDVVGRNQELVAGMKRLLGMAAQGLEPADPEEPWRERFDEVRAASAEFRQGTQGGGQYARRLLCLFGFRHADAARRGGIAETLAELIRLMPDPDRRRELARAAADGVEELARQAGPPRARLGEEEEAAAASAGSELEARLEASAFPSLDGGSSPPAAGGAAFTGAWLARPREAFLPAPAPSVTPAGAVRPADPFPALRDGGGPVAGGPMGAWGGSAAAAAAAAGGGEGVERGPGGLMTRKTKRGHLLVL